MMMMIILPLFLVDFLPILGEWPLLFFFPASIAPGWREPLAFTSSSSSCFWSGPSFGDGASDTTEEEEGASDPGLRFARPPARPTAGARSLLPPSSSSYSRSPSPSSLRLGGISPGETQLERRQVFLVETGVQSMKAPFFPFTRPPSPSSFSSFFFIF